MLEPRLKSLGRPTLTVLWSSDESSREVAVQNFSTFFSCANAI